VSSSRPQPKQVEAAIREAFQRGHAGIEDVAQILCVSRSTVERSLAQPLDGREATDFTQLRNVLRVSIALDLLTSGVPIRNVAERVCVSADHLTVLVRRAVGLAPGEISRAILLRGRVSAWKREGPLRPGTMLYRKRLREWDRIDAQMVALLGDLDASHPLAAWAKALLTDLERPDYRREPFRKELEDKKRERSEALEKQLFSVLGPNRAAAVIALAKHPAATGS
jgi:AraC-like DNA-binding protein